MNIRPATAADIPFIMNLERQCSTAAHWTEQQYGQLFNAGDSGAARIVLVAEATLYLSSGPENNPDTGVARVGFLVARQIAPEWELENIVVTSNARNRGLGKRLLDALLAEAIQTNSTAVFLEVRGSNTAARALYERAGFQQTGRRKSYYADPPEDAVLYRRSLG